MIKYPPANAGDMGSITDLKTQIRHVPGQLGLCTTKKEKKYSKHLFSVVDHADIPNLGIEKYYILII